MKKLFVAIMCLCFFGISLNSFASTDNNEKGDYRNFNLGDTVEIVKEKLDNTDKNEIHDVRYLINESDKSGTIKFDTNFFNTETNATFFFSNNQLSKITIGVMCDVDALSKALTEKYGKSKTIHELFGFWRRPYITLKLNRVYVWRAWNLPDKRIFITVVRYSSTGIFELQIGGKDFNPEGEMRESADEKIKNDLN